jgi:RNA polymerase sigma-70 factor (ECF subfamily)
MDYSTISHERLLRLCMDFGQPEVWEEFIVRFNPVISAVALRTARRWCPSAEISVEDLVQEVYMKLCADSCKILRGFQAEQQDSIFAFFKVVTANLVHDKFRSQKAAKRGFGEAPVSYDDSPTAATEVSEKVRSTSEVIERDILLREIDEHLFESIPTQDRLRSRTVFWLYYRSGLSASAISALPNIGLSTKGVESMLLRLTRQARNLLVTRDVNSPERGLGLSAENKGL